MRKESTRERIIAELRESGAQIMVNYLPVGSEEATRFYVGCALEAGLALVNNIPVFIASDPVWAKRFEEKNLPLVGDDIKAQMGATVLHRTLVDLFRKRGVKIERTYQLNTGGNTDFLNMLNRSRLASKKTSKTEAVQSVIGARLADENIHIGPSDYVPWQNDNKICFIRVEGNSLAMCRWRSISNFRSRIRRIPPEWRSTPSVAASSRSIAGREACSIPPPPISPSIRPSN